MLAIECIPNMKRVSMSQELYFLPNQDVVRKISKMLLKAPDRNTLMNLIKTQMQIHNISYHHNTMNHPLFSKPVPGDGSRGLNYDEFCIVYKSVFEALKRTGR